MDAVDSTGVIKLSGDADRKVTRRACVIVPSAIAHRHAVTHARMETFRRPPMTSKRTTRIQDEGAWSGVGGRGTCVCGAATVQFENVLLDI